MHAALQLLLLLLQKHTARRHYDMADEMRLQGKVAFQVPPERAALSRKYSHLINIMKWKFIVVRRCVLPIHTHRLSNLLMKLWRSLNSKCQKLCGIWCCRQSEMALQILKDEVGLSNNSCTWPIWLDENTNPYPNQSLIFRHENNLFGQPYIFLL